MEDYFTKDLTDYVEKYGLEALFEKLMHISTDQAGFYRTTIFGEREDAWAVNSNILYNILNRQPKFDFENGTPVK